MYQNLIEVFYIRTSTIPTRAKRDQLNASVLVDHSATQSARAPAAEAKTTARKSKKPEERASSKRKIEDVDDDEEHD